jgi:hypothetical protein
MGTIILRELLARLDEFEPDDVVYVPLDAAVDMDTVVRLLNFQVSETAPPGTSYFLEIGTMREIRDGLRDEIGRDATVQELTKAAVFYANHDAFIDPAEL